MKHQLTKTLTKLILSIKGKRPALLTQPIMWKFEFKTLSLLIFYICPTCGPAGTINFSRPVTQAGINQHLFAYLFSLLKQNGQERILLAPFHFNSALAQNHPSLPVFRESERKLHRKCHASLPKYMKMESRGESATYIRKENTSRIHAKPKVTRTSYIITMMTW